MVRVFIFMIICLVFCQANASADVLVFKNGDRLTGSISRRSESSTTVVTDHLGELTVDNAVIDHVVSPDPNMSSTGRESSQSAVTAAKAAPVAWDNNLTLGYDKSGGNTRSSAGFITLKVSRKQELNELSGRAETSYASERNKLTSQKHFWEIRDDFRQASDSKWFNFIRFQADHDRFSNIDYRLIPSAGRGFHFAESETFNALTEASVGYQYTDYRDDTGPTGETVLVPRAYVDKTFWRGLKASQDLTFYPSLAEISHYRFKSESALTQPLTDHLSWKFSLIDEFNSFPTEDAKKNDYRLMTGINYKF